MGFSFEVSLWSYGGGALTRKTHLVIDHHAL